MNSQGRQRSQHRRPGESSSIGSGAYFGSGGRGGPGSRRRVLYRRTTPRPFIRRTSRPLPAVEWDRSDGPEYEAEAFFEFEKDEDQDESWLVWFIKLFFGCGLVWFASVAAAYNRLNILIQVFIFIFIIQSDMSVSISCNNSGALSIVVGILKSREGTSSS